jgi:maleate cis-trans isomerase
VHGCVLVYGCWCGCSSCGKEYASALRAQVEEKEAQKRAAKQRERLEAAKEVEAETAERASAPGGQAFTR